MKRSRTPGAAPEDVLGLLAAAGPVGAAQAPSLAAPSDDPAELTEFTLDADAWEEWENWRISTTRSREIPPGGGWRAHGRRSPQARRCWRAAPPRLVHLSARGRGRLLQGRLRRGPRRRGRGYRRRVLAAGQDWFWVDDMPVDAVTTDNGADFCSGLFAELPARCRVAHLRTRAYRPQANGEAQRRLPGCRRGRAET